MNCIKCGGPLHGLNCEKCGFNISKDAFTIISKVAFPLDAIKEYIQSNNKMIADGVIGMIRNISHVEYSNSCKKKIDEARTAYEALDENQKEIVDSINIKDLIAAELKYEELYLEASIEKKDRKIFPNDLCPCGSGIKYNNCHGKKEEIATYEASITNDKGAKNGNIQVEVLNLKDGCSSGKTLDEKRTIIDTGSFNKAKQEYGIPKHKVESGSKKKRSVAIITAALVVCLGAFALFKTVFLHFEDSTPVLSDSFIGSAKQGDAFLLGKYEQDNNLENGAEDIEWIVVSNENGIILAVSKYCLDNKAFNETDNYETTNWENCTLRKWLNQDFYNNVFSEDEKKWICSTNLENTDALFYKTAGGYNTTDKVFILGCMDLSNNYPNYEFGLMVMNLEGNYRMAKTTTIGEDSYEALKVKYTDYAKENYIKAQCETWVNRTEESIRADYSELEKKYGENTCSWWLRTPGDNWYSTMTVTWSGIALDNPSQSTTMGVRPVIIVSDKNLRNTNELDLLNNTINKENENPIDQSSEDFESIMPIQVITDYQQMLFVSTDGQVARIGYVMEDYADVFDWTDIKKVAVGNGIIVGLTTSGTLRFLSAVENNYDVDSLLKLNQIKDVCICSKAVNPKNESYNGCIICLSDDGTAYFSYEGGYLEYLNGVKSIDASYNKYALLLEDGTVTGAKYDNGVYTEVPEWTGITQVVCGENFIAGLKSDGSVITSGNYLIKEMDGVSLVNEDFSYEEKNIANDVSNWADVVYLSAGLNHLSGLKNDGTVLSAGLNTYGQCNTDEWKNIKYLSASNNATIGYLNNGEFIMAGKNIAENAVSLQNSYSTYIHYHK